MKLPEHIEDAIEEQGWSIYYTDDGYVELETHSPLGEDLVETIEVENFVENLRYHVRCFDPDDHAAMWVYTRGTNGVPHNVLALAQDALDIQEMLDKLLDAVVKADGEYTPFRLMAMAG